MNNGLAVRRSILAFVLLELGLSIPFWGIGALATAGMIPDQVLLRASWSLTPMLAAAILMYREAVIVGVVGLVLTFEAYRGSIRRSATWIASWSTGSVDSGDRCPAPFSRRIRCTWSRRR